MSQNEILEPTSPTPPDINQDSDNSSPIYEPTLPFPQNEPVIDTEFEENVEEPIEQNDFNSDNNGLVTSPINIPRGRVIGLQRRSCPNIFIKAMSMVALSLGHRLIYFDSSLVDYDNKLINAYIYDPTKDGFIQQKVEYPDIVDNDNNYINSRMYDEFVKNEDIPYTFYPLGNKYNILKKIEQIEYIPQYMIPYIRTSSIVDIVDFLKQYKVILLKSVNSSEHKAIKIRYYNDHLISINTDYSIYVEKLPNYLLDRIFNNDIKNLKKYIIQQYIESFINEKPFDITIHICRAYNSSWRIVAGYSKYGLFSTNNIVSNEKNRFCINDGRHFLVHYFNDAEKGVHLFEGLKSLSFRIAENLQNFYPEHLINGLAIDFGITEQGRVYIFEVNSLPVTNWYNLEHAILAVHYDLWMINPGLN